MDSGDLDRHCPSGRRAGARREGEGGEYCQYHLGFTRRRTANPQYAVAHQERVKKSSNSC